MKRKLDIDVITEILAGKNTQEKVETLEELVYQLPEWDIFPIQMVLTGLADQDAEVRSLTFSLLSYRPEMLSQQDLVKVLCLIEDGGKEVQRQIVEEVNSFAQFIESDTLKDVLPYLWHRDGDVRDTAVQVFTELSHRFTEEMFLVVTESYSTNNMDIRESIAEFLEQNGQDSLLTTK